MASLVAVLQDGSMMGCNRPIRIGCGSRKTAPSDPDGRRRGPSARSPCVPSAASRISKSRPRR